jgi:hypothetical protein
LLQARYWFSKVFYHSLQIGNPGAVALVLNSGVTLIRRPFDVKVMRTNVRGTEPYFYRTPGPSGTAFIQSAQSGVMRLNTYRHHPHCLCRSCVVER